MLELFLVSLVKHIWQRPIFVAPSLLALNFVFDVCSILSKKERKESFVSILNLLSLSLCDTHNLLCLFLKQQKLDCEETCAVHVSVPRVKPFDSQRACAPLTAHGRRTPVLAHVLFLSPIDNSVK